MNTEHQPVTETHWAQSDRERFSDFCAGLPAILDAEHALWQLRVDRSKTGIETAFVAHQHLFRMEALEYAKRADGVSAPTGKELSFLVLGDNAKEVTKKVYAQLEAHGLGSNWMLRHGPSVLVLA